MTSGSCDDESYINGIEIREVEGQEGQKALFAAQMFKVGDVILNEKKPLIFGDRHLLLEISTRGLQGLKKALDECITCEEEKEELFGLFCPSEEELQKTMENYDQVLQMARETCNNNAEETEELIKLFYIWNFNSTRYLYDKTAVFKYHARMNHSCCPNAVVNPSDGIVRAAKPIDTNEMITISYLHVGMQLASTRIRRKTLLEDYNFFCNCLRCTRKVDLCRIMRCAECSKHSLIYGLGNKYKDNNKNDTEIRDGGAETKTKINDDSGDAIIATCVNCNTSFGTESMQSLLELEKNLEDEVLALQEYCKNTTGDDMSFQQKIQLLHKRILNEIGGVHWTAAAMLSIRCQYHPIKQDNNGGFVVLQWGEAIAKWCKLIMDDILGDRLSHVFLSSLGSGCTPHLNNGKDKNSKVQIAGRRYWNESYETCKSLWGENNDDVQNMRTMFINCKENKKRTDIFVCINSKCTTPIIDDDGDSVEKEKEEPTTAETTLRACAACSIARYCNKECQKEDWKYHKEVCIACRALKELEDVKLWFANHRELLS